MLVCLCTSEETFFGLISVQFRELVLGTFHGGDEHCNTFATKSATQLRFLHALKLVAEDILEIISGPADKAPISIPKGIAGAKVSIVLLVLEMDFLWTRHPVDVASELKDRELDIHGLRS
ncbi:MAG: hypothetical protein Q9182_000605 [Xanthomendoza sp. 2 TL-2023]